MRACPKCQRTYPDDTDFCARDGTALPAAATVTQAELAAGLARRYRIVRRLGAGGMGNVFLAEQIALGNRPVAVKVLLRKLLDDPEFLLRFNNEAASTARIRHPNVITVHESGQSEDGSPYIAMEYLEGETLRQALKARGALSVPETVDIIQQVARGLNAAHRLGIIHRDLKPDNIFLTRADEDLVGEGSALPTGTHRAPVVVKVMDFGIAKLRESATHTLTGTVLGTPAYMSFEQASGMRSDELDARSDIYSLGVVVYEMLTGRVPFHSDTPLGYVRKHMLEEPPPFRAVAPGLPVAPEIERVVMKALKKQREERYSSVLEFARELARAIEARAPVEIREPLPSTKIAQPPLRAHVGEVSGLPSGVAEGSALPAQSAVQTPPPTPPRGIVEPPPREQPRAEQQVPAVSPPPGTRPPRLQVTTESPSQAKYVVLGLLVLAGIVGGIWYFSRPGEQQQQNAVTQPSEATRPLPAPQVKENPKDGLKYVWIPPGTFQMGCSPGDSECGPDEKPAHQVTISKGFWMGQTEVTVAAYKRFARQTRHAMPPAPDFNGGWNNQAQPIVKISWNDAQAYCQWAGGRLPTEAEWEYAARGGNTEARYGPIDEVAWYSNNSGGKTHEVAQKRPNAWNLYDTLGNVWEWVNDWYGENHYPASPERDPQGPNSSQYRVLRGGSWYSNPGLVRVSHRGRIAPVLTNDGVGVRCAREVEPQTRAGQQGPVVETPAAPSESPAGSGTTAASRRQQIQAAHAQGDSYYETGDYDNATSSYQAGLKLDPSNAGLREALRRAQNAKAAEAKFNQ